MDDNFIDDGYEARIPTHRDRDADAADMVRTFEATPEAKHHEAEESAGVYAKMDLVQKILSDEKAITCLEDPNDQRTVEAAAIQEKAAKASSGTGADASTASPGASSGAADTAFGTAPAGGDGTPAAGALPKPDSLESTLANIRLNGNRQRRLVITGDEAIKTAFYERLAAAGKLHYSGGSPVITLSRSAALKELAKVAKEFEGASATHAVSMKMEREGLGMVGSIAAGLKNNFPLGRSHRLDIVVVGNSAVQDAKMKEIGAFVETMKEKGHLVPSKGPAEDGQVHLPRGKVEDGKLVLQGGAPVSIKATASMGDVLSAAKRKVDAFNTAKSAEQAEVKAHKHEKDLVSMAKDREKSGDGDGTASGKDGKMAVNENTAKLADRLDKAIHTPGALTTKNDKNTEEGVLLLRDARKRKDPETPELATLPDGVRGKAVVQLAALVQKADANTFGPAFKKELDNPKEKSEPSIREKVDLFISMEAKRDPSFADKAAPLLKDMVERGVLTQKQADTVADSVAAAVAVVKAAGAKEAPAADASKASGATTDGAAAGTPAGTAASKDAGAGKAPGAEPAGTDLRATTSTGGDAKAAPAPAAESKSLATDSSATLAANSASPADGAKASRVEPTFGPPAGAESKPVSASSSTGDASTKGTDQPTNLRERIEAIAKDGPANLTAEKAHALVAELDGLRSKPLPSLDGGSGSDPTRTLARTEALLKELESGRFGAELKAQAKDLAEPLQKWEKQDIARFNNDRSVATVSRDDVVAGVKSGLSTWDGAGQAAQKDTAAAVKESAPAPAPGSAGATTGLSKEATVATSQAPTAAPSPAEKEASSAPAQSGAGTTGSASKDASVAASPATAATTAPATKESAPLSAEDSAAAAAKVQAANRLTETESAGGKLSAMMANPAGSFTNRDKTWNVESFQRAATEVLRIDPESVTQMSGAQRAKLAAYSSWVAENARDGKVPGFTSEEGKAQASQLVERAVALIGKMENGTQLSPDVQKSLTKADNMVNAMEQLEKSASATSQVSRDDVSRGGIGAKAAASLSTDLVHAVYRQAEVSDALAKYLLKNAPNLTPESTKSLDPQVRAQTAVAMGHLAQQVKDGAMGDFSKLPSSVQKSVVSAANAAESMLTSMGKDPSMRAELNQAYSELHAKNAGTAKSAGSASTNVDAQGHSAGGAAGTPGTGKPVEAGSTKSADAEVTKSAAPAATKPEGRSLDR